MTSNQLISQTGIAPAPITLPGQWQAEVEKELASGENVLSGVEVDLDDPGVRRDLDVIEPVIVRRRCAFEGADRQ